MGIVVNLYKSVVADKGKGSQTIPKVDRDALNLKYEEKIFRNSQGIGIHYYFYQKDVKYLDKIVVFCHGVSGMGHFAYISEINELCSNGYKVLTLDYTGCGNSEGGRLESMVIPTRDIDELLNHLKLKEKIILVGHSMGGFSILNLASIRNDIYKVVAISPFINLFDQMKSQLKYSFLANIIVKYERKVSGHYIDIDLKSFLQKTDKNIMVIQSKDDGMCSYQNNLGTIISYNNPHIVTLTVEGKKHNPNYTYDALAYMNECMGMYFYLLKKKKLKNLEQQLDYFKDKSAEKMTVQDKDVWSKIFEFID